MTWLVVLFYYQYKTMKKSIFTLILAAIAMQGANAKVRTTSQLINEAKRALVSNSSRMKAAKANAGAIKVLKRDAQMSIVGYENGNCVAIANDDTFEPVLGYFTASADGTVNPALQWWMQAMNQSLTEKLANGEQPRYTAPKKEYKESVAPLLTTTWSQETPYNNLCPEYSIGVGNYRYLTGCVATAMAQVFNYYKFPTKGTGSHKWTYYPDGENGKGVDKSQSFRTSYDWANMLDSYKGNYTTAQAKAVATLMRDCGAAASMQYTPDGSGTTNYEALVGMRRNLCYDQASKNYLRDFTPSVMWMEMVYDELNEGRPIIYSGATPDNSGHCFVFDGYDKAGLVHVEWGWGGQGDGYFDMSLLNSEQGSFSEGQQMILVRKPGETDYTYHSMWGTNGFEMTINGNTLNIGKVSFYNIDVDNFTGQVQLLCMKTDGSKGYLLSNISELKDIEYGHGGSIELGDIIDLTKFPEGTWQIYFGSLSSSTDNPETGWYPIFGGDGCKDNYFLTVSNGTYKLVAGNDDWSLPTGISSVKADGKPVNSRIFSIDGRSLGTDLNTLGKGLYIVNGKKIMK